MRMRIQSMLQTVHENSFQGYPDVEEQYPCLVWSLTSQGVGTHDGFGNYDKQLRIELYTNTSAERNVLENSLIRTLLSNGWINTSNRELPDPEYYRHDFTFERKE